MRQQELVHVKFLEQLGEKGRESIRIDKARARYDRRFVYIVVYDDDQILREYWPASDENMKAAEEFADGYAMGKLVWKEFTSTTKGGSA
jgi:hypothetical protein